MKPPQFFALASAFALGAVGALLTAKWQGTGSLLAVALAASALVMAMVRSARARTDLQRERARAAAIVASSGDAIIGETLDGIVTEWNLGAERLFGFTAAEACGRPMAALLLPPERAHEHTDIRSVILRGEMVRPFDTTRRRSDGTMIDVAMTASPILDPRGRCVGISKTIRDISEARRAEQRMLELNAVLERQAAERSLSLASALRDNDALLRTLHEHALVSVTDRAGLILEVNDAFCALSGYSRTELIGHDHRIVNSGTHKPAFWRGLWGCVSEGRSWRGEVCNRAKDGSVYWVDSMIAPFRDEAGRIEKYIAIRTDITAAKQAEAKLFASQAFLERAGTVGGIGAWQLDLRTQETTWTEQMYRIYELDPACVPTNEDSYGVFPGESRLVVERAVQSTMDTGVGWDLELPLVTWRGRELWVRTIGGIELDDGGPLRLIGTVQDITARKRAEIEQLATSSLLTTVLDSATEVAIIAIGPDHLITVFNRGAERLLGYTSQEVVGRETPAFMHVPQEVSAFAAELKAATGEDVPRGDVFMHPLAITKPREWTFVRKDGSRVVVVLVIAAMHGHDGALLGHVGVAYDVSRQKEQEASLREAKEAAERSNLAKSQFLANMSHEIRTPMNAIIGLSYLLAQTPLEGDQGALLARVQVASKSLLGVINDILDVSKIEAGELTLEKTPFRLSTLLGELRDVVSVNADAKHLVFSIGADEGTPDYLEGDSVRLGQILTNLLSNAVKFTERGAVTLTVRLDSRSEESASLVFEVQDSGIGIPEAAQARLFAPFAQADSSTTRRFGGTGLGLSIVKRLSVLMGGSVTLSSAPGLGSRFTVALPFGVTSAFSATPARRPYQGPAALRGVRVLVTDDSEVNLIVAQRILQQRGATVALARNGYEAFERLRDQPEAFDVVLMDVQMPVLDGCEATERIKREVPLARMPIIALTADARASERQRTQTAGMVDFVSKPFEVEAVIACILRHLAPAAAPPIAAELPAPVAPPPARIPGSVTRMTSGWPSIEGLDVSALRETIDDDQPLFDELLESVLDDYAGAIAVSERANDARWLHKLKGMAAQIKATTLQELARSAEAACKADQPERAAELVAKIAAELGRICTSATAYLESRRAA